MGRRGPLPLESPNWIPFADALSALVERTRSASLAVDVLDRAIEAGHVRCKLAYLDEPVRLDPATGVLMSRHKVELPKPGTLDIAVALDLGNDKLAEGWADEIDIKLRDEPREGHLFVWKPDQLKYFGGDEIAAPAKAAKGQKPPEKAGRPLLHDWVELALIAVHLHLDNPNYSRNKIVETMIERLTAEGAKVPASSELQRMLKQVFAFRKWRLPKRP
jgi:hypothetical protein